MKLIRHFARMGKATQKRTRDEIDRLRNSVERQKRAEQAIKQLPDELETIYYSAVQPWFNTAEGGWEKELLESMMEDLYGVIESTVMQTLLKIAFSEHDLGRDEGFDWEVYFKRYLRRVEKNYRKRLNEQERSCYDLLDESKKAAFRICLDLALTGKMDDGRFYLSYNGLAARLYIHPEEASRMMKFFTRIPIVSVIEKGTQRKRNQIAKATVYVWKLRGILRKGDPLDLP